MSLTSYSYGDSNQSVNLLVDGNYLSWSSVTPSGTVAGPTNLAVQQAIQDLPIFPTGQSGNISGNEVMALVDVDNILGSTSTFKITLSRLSEYFTGRVTSPSSPAEGTQSAPGANGLNFHGDLILDLNKYVMWSDTSQLVPNNIGIQMDLDANLLFTDITNSNTFMTITRSGQVGLGTSSIAEAPLVAGMIAFNGAEFYGSTD